MGHNTVVTYRDIKDAPCEVQAQDIRDSQDSYGKINTKESY